MPKKASTFIPIYAIYITLYRIGDYVNFISFFLHYYSNKITSLEQDQKLIGRESSQKIRSICLKGQEQAHEAVQETALTTL